MSRSFLVSAVFGAATLTLGAAALMGSSSSSQAATGLWQCDGPSRAEVIDCCERTAKPVWWKRSGNSCHSPASVRCYKARGTSITHVSSGKMICKIVQTENQNSRPQRDNGPKGGKGSDRGGQQGGGQQGGNQGSSIN
jgi:hypothetical protein